MFDIACAATEELRSVSPTEPARGRTETRCYLDPAQTPGMRSLLSRLLTLFGVSAEEAEGEPPLPLSDAEYDWLEMEYPSYQSVRPPSNPFF